MKPNSIYCGDSAKVLADFPEASVDLIYLDPPFFTQKQYEVLWDDGFELRAFEDRWKGGVQNFIAWMEPKLRECHRVLKANGSFYLHCDYRANAHLRVLLDTIFGANRFTAEVIWEKGFRGTEKAKNWQRAHDTIFFYTKGDGYTWNDQYQEYADKEMSRYNKVDKDGKKHALIKRRRGDGSVYYGKCYPNLEGKRVNDVLPIPTLASTAKERLGYPTQKPEALLERIITASSNPTDLVLDPFCGCGTTIAVAHKLGRRFVGVDISPTACKLMVRRLRGVGAKIGEGDIIGMPKTLEELKAMQPFEFQNWACQKLGARVNQRKTGDMGIDGWVMGTVAVQVKQSEGIGRNVIDNFETAIKRAKKTKGIVIAFTFGRGAHEEVARAKNEEGLDIELVTVKDLMER